MIENLKSKVIVSPEYKFIGHPINYAKEQNSLRDSALAAKRISSRLYELTLSKDSANSISKLKLTNSGIVLWEDFWVDGRNMPRDPRIEYLELQNSITLNSVNVPYYRPGLREVNLSGCKNLTYLNLSRAPSLERIWLDRCYSLNEVHLGFNKQIRSISLRWCSLPERALEQILSEYIPTRSELRLSGHSLEYDSFLDLRGNVIPWENRRIASKIRMLLCNNVAVAWSANPPERVIPAELYRKFGI